MDNYKELLLEECWNLERKYDRHVHFDRSHSDHTTPRSPRIHLYLK